MYVRMYSIIDVIKFYTVKSRVARYKVMYYSRRGGYGVENLRHFGRSTANFLLCFDFILFNGFEKFKHKAK